MNIERITRDPVVMGGRACIRGTWRYRKRATLAQWVRTHYISRLLSCRGCSAGDRMVCPAGEGVIRQHPGGTSVAAVILGARCRVP